MDMTKDETSNGSDLLKLFANRFLHLLENDMDCDCEFIVGSQNTVIRGHKFLFSAASEVFYAMFHGDLQEKNAVQVEDLDAEGFEGMKQFIYTGEVEFTSALQALLIYIAARKYMIAFLSQQCVTFINKENSIQPSEVLEFYELCKLHNIPQFEKQCYEIIQQKTDEVVDSEFFVSAAPETIEIILKSPYLNLKSEVDVIHLFERWVKAGAESKGIGVGKMMSTGNINYLKKHIRFLTISSDEFVRDVSGSLILTAEEKIAVACNLITSDTKPMPESLSLERQTREFIKFQYISIFEPKIYSRNHNFVVSINNPTNTCNEYDIKFNDGDISNKISYIKFKQYICFQLETETKKLYENSEHVMKFGFKLTMSTENKCKKKIIILHQNDVYVILKWTSLHTQKIVFATIPISKLKSLNSLKVNDDHVIIIHCSFNIKYLE